MRKKEPPSVEEIIANKWLVEFNRKPLDKRPLFGFVLSATDELTLIHQLDRDLFQLDDYCVFPNRDVRKFAVYNRDDYFLSEVIKVRKIIPIAVPKVSIASWKDVIETASKSFPFLVVETERVHKNECYVGELAEMKKRGFSLREVDSEAVWYKSVTKYKFDDLTMIKFGGRYEETLALVSSNREKKSK